MVREDRVFPGVEPVEGALYWASVASLPFALDRLVHRLAAAADGNPETKAGTATDETAIHIHYRSAIGRAHKLGSPSMNRLPEESVAKSGLKRRPVRSSR